MKHLLIAGFGPFPGAPDNPSGAAVSALQAQGWSPPGAQAAYAVLPTVWDQAATLALDAAQAAEAQALLLVGVATGADGFRIETLAHNHADTSRPDAEGRHAPDPAIEPGGPPLRLSAAPVRAMRAAVEAEGLPAALSEDAGDYLCNFTLYQALGPYPMSAFLHVPAVGERVTPAHIQAAIRAAAGAMTAHAV